MRRAPLGWLGSYVLGPVQRFAMLSAPFSVQKVNEQELGSAEHNMCQACLYASQTLLPAY